MLKDNMYVFTNLFFHKKKCIRMHITHTYAFPFPFPFTLIFYHFYFSLLNDDATKRPTPLFYAGIIDAGIIFRRGTLKLKGEVFLCLQVVNNSDFFGVFKSAKSFEMDQSGMLGASLRQELHNNININHAVIIEVGPQCLSNVNGSETQRHALNGIIFAEHEIMI